MTLVVEEGEAGRLWRLAAAAYPEEGCGVLVGAAAGDVTRVTVVVEGRNLVQERRLDRYELDPADILRADRLARQRGLEVVGFYHTHPDHPARPSPFDTERAWPGYHYVVIAVERGRVAAATAWVLDEPARRFDAVPMVPEVAVPGPPGTGGPPGQDGPGPGAPAGGAILPADMTVERG
ncbi:MAG TPA: M67 family metallopeptidase [Candidatus Micrarchaeia archaeon]|nr:M67 family metallopeptidase [Candidatus Micrarchaeia archaeon]